MLVRKAILDDADLACEVLRLSIIELCGSDHRNQRQTLEAWLNNKTPENVREWFSDPRRYCVVADVNSRIVGVGSITSHGEIGLLYVAPTARFQGVSKQMLASLEYWAQSHGLASVFY